MRKHHGMRPQDIVILLKIIAKGNRSWQNKDLATELFISQSEISDSLARSAVAKLIEPEKKKKVYRQALLEFLQFGLQYVFPVQPGHLSNGIYTAISHPFMKEHFSSDINYVWADFDGEGRGMVVEPLYKEVVKAVKIDPTLYKMLALIDVIRIGRVREFKLAIKELHQIILHEPSNQSNQNQGSI